MTSDDVIELVEDGDGVYGQSKELARVGFVPVLSTTVPATGSHQDVYRFANGYGASVISGGIGVYGRYELAVTRFNSEDVDDFSLDYSTPITDDVIGYLGEDEIPGILAQIKALPHSRKALTK